MAAMRDSPVWPSLPMVASETGDRMQCFLSTTSRSTMCRSRTKPVQSPSISSKWTRTSTSATSTSRNCPKGNTVAQEATTRSRPSAHVVMHDVTHTSSWPTHTDRLHPAHRASRPRPRSEDPDVCEAGCDTRVTRGAGVLATPSYQPQNFSGVSRTLPQATTISLPIVSQKRHTLATLIVRNQG